MGDCLPRQDGMLVIWLTQFKTELAASATDLGVVTADVTSITTDVTGLLSAIQDQAGKVAEQQATTAAKKSAKGSVVPKVRAIVKRIKSLPNYTAEAGQRLGIVAPSQDLAGPGSQTAAVQPVLTAGQVRNGHVAVRFLKNGFSGIQIAGKRGDGDFVVLKTQMRSPFVDERVNLGKGPETRYYQARYLDGDDLVGEASDILVVTVPE